MEGLHHREERRRSDERQQGMGHVQGMGGGRGDARGLVEHMDRDGRIPSRHHLGRPRLHDGRGDHPLHLAHRHGRVHFCLLLHVLHLSVVAGPVGIGHRDRLLHLHHRADLPDRPRLRRAPAAQLDRGRARCGRGRACCAAHAGRRGRAGPTGGRHCEGGVHRRQQHQRAWRDRRRASGQGTPAIGQALDGRRDDQRGEVAVVLHGASAMQVAVVLPARGGRHRGRLAHGAVHTLTSPRDALVERAHTAGAGPLPRRAPSLRRVRLVVDVIGRWLPRARLRGAGASSVCVSVLLEEGRLSAAITPPTTSGAP
mmetsp:Transcript_73276/g.212241  ORF Transcript_73276/g.212241 Transcript_73276/m.212241 type:complete len:312 (+) Transcript_73276:2245-3180(+)